MATTSNFHNDTSDETVVADIFQGAIDDAGIVAVTASGAISIPTVDTTYMITKSSAGAALTLADPPNDATHNGVKLTFISTTAQAHSVDNSAGSGFNGGGSGVDVGTFGGAIGDGFSIIAYGGKWIIRPGQSKNVTLG